MSTPENDGDPTTGIDDEQLPEDLRPTDDNPLAQPLSGEDAPDPADLDMDGGKRAVEMDDPDSPADPVGPDDVE
ncbi:hypothetical protein [Nocardioides sp.]|uniref:hypothetical protein n=1 Tax=Nocardioides sp. TaxID=35761 RepID=UPI003569F26D